MELASKGKLTTFTYIDDRFIFTRHTDVLEVAMKQSEKLDTAFGTTVDTKNSNWMQVGISRSGLALSTG